jgi:3-methyladenine DNA glycosylase AlkD
MTDIQVKGKKGQGTATAKPLTASAVADLIDSELRQLADPKRAESAQRFFTAPIPALGIDAATQRGFAKNWIRKLKGQWNVKAAIVLCGLLFQRPHIEARGAGFLVLAGFQTEFDKALFHQAEQWLGRYLDNWALVDGFSAEVLTPLLRRHPELMAELPRWAGNGNLWIRRAAVVTLVPFARKGERLDESYRLVESLFGDPEDLMHKATGWLLRDAGKTNAKRLETFLLRHHSAIPRTTVRYAIERFPAAERKRLLELTRGSGAPHSTANPSSQTEKGS